MKNIAVVLLLFLVTLMPLGCANLVGPTVEDHPDGPLVVTTVDNVVAPPGEEPVILPFDQLTDKWDKWFRDTDGDPLEVTLVPKGWVVDVSNDEIPVIHLNQDATEDLLSPGVINVISGAVGAAFPPAAPFLPLLGLLFPRVRRNGANLVKNLTPGIQGTNGGGNGIDIFEAGKDALRVVGFLDSSRADRDVLALVEDERAVNVSGSKDAEPEKPTVLNE